MGPDARTGQHSYAIHNAHHVYSFETQQPRLHFEALVPVSQLTLQDILDVAYSVVIFGRLYYMQELSCIMSLVPPGPGVQKHVYGSFSVVPTPEMTGSIAGVNDTAFQ